VALTCPACGKNNQAGPVCARCGCDLSRLHTVTEAAVAALAEAHASLRAMDWSTALAWAGKSWQLCHSAKAARLAFLAAVGLGQTDSALTWRRRGAE
jgi:hypothetical protein